MASEEEKLLNSLTGDVDELMEEGDEEEGNDEFIEAEDEAEEEDEEEESPINSAEYNNEEEGEGEEPEVFNYVTKKFSEIAVGSDEELLGEAEFERTDVSISATVSFAKSAVQKAESKMKEVASVGTSITIPKPPKPPTPPRPIVTRKDGLSTISLHAKYPGALEGEPSELDLFYEAGDVDIELREVPLTVLPENQQASQNIGTELHRSSKIFGHKPKPKMWNNISQTREMSLVNKHMAEKVFRHYYPIRDDYTPPAIPSRAASLDSTIEKLEEDKDGDKVKLGPKIKWPRKMRLLPSLPENYYKSSTFWTGSEFSGQYFNGQFQHGNYVFPLGATYASEFENGHIHTSKHKGLITYPRGDTFEGEWKKGRHTSGKIIFGDELEYENKDWKYCQPPDRRFYIERDIGVKPAGRTLYNDRIPQPLLPPGHYDTGDGIFNPNTGIVTGFRGQKLREPNIYERQWILQNCRKFKRAEERYTPKFNITRLPGSFAEKYVKQ